MKFRSEDEAKKYVKDILYSFNDHEFISNIIFETQWLLLREKGILAGDKKNYHKFRSLSLGEYRGIQGGIVNILLSLLSEEDKISREKLRDETASQVVFLTDDYYLDRKYNRPKPYLTRLTDKIIDELIAMRFAESIGTKVRRTSFDASDLVTEFYGKAVMHGMGKSSFHRVLVIGTIAEAGFIQEYFVDQKLRELLKANGIKKDHVLKTIYVHGASGTGYILQDDRNFLCRMYKRLDSSKLSRPSILENNEELRIFVMNTPFITDSIIYQKFGPQIQKQLKIETDQVSPYTTNAILVRRGDSYILGSHVNALKLRNCDIDNNPVIDMIKYIYTKFSADDVPKVAFYLREVTHGLVKEGEYKPVNEFERKILVELERNKLVERGLLEDDVYFVTNHKFIKEMSIILGNVLD